MSEKKAKKLFDKYYSRLVWEGAIKALICGLVIAFSAMIVAATITWITAYNGALWVTLVSGIATLTISAPILFFVLFRPTTEGIAKRLDGLGLEERLITMLELEKDESYIAMRQREDAKAKLNAVGVKQVKLGVSKTLIVVVAVLFGLAVSLTTVSALTAKSVIPPVIDRGDQEAPVYFSVNYVVLGYKGNEEYVEDEGGIIMGEFDQVVEAGQSTTTVMAVADDGWFFLGWLEDGSPDPSRADANIEEDMTFTAVFILGQENDDEAQSGDGDGEPGDDPQESDQQQSSSGPSETPDEPGKGSGSYTDNDKIKDGETNYKDLFDEYYRQAMEILASGGEIPDELREMLERYFEMLR